MIGTHPDSRFFPAWSPLVEAEADRHLTGRVRVKDLRARFDWGSAVQVEGRRHGGPQGGFLTVKQEPDHPAQPGLGDGRDVVQGRDTVVVEAAVAELLAQVPDPAAMSFDDVVEFHWRFESIHPFQDGNGRVGRVVLFEQCLAAGLMPLVVLDAEKRFYYRGLAEYEDQPGFLRDTLRHFQDAYRTRHAALATL
jgi:hypothetical protein